MFGTIRSSVQTKPVGSWIFTVSHNFTGKVSPIIGTIRTHQASTGTGTGTGTSINNQPKSTNMEKIQHPQETTAKGLSTSSSSFCSPRLLPLSAALFSPRKLDFTHRQPESAATTIAAALFSLEIAYMVDVARAHGGDAGGDPPRGPYRIPAPCEAAPKKRGRGKATYKKLKDAYDKNGKKPLPIEFDMRDLRTFQPVGDNHSNFTRFIGTWIDLNVPLYYDRWDLVPEQYRVGLWSELQRYFDFAPFQAGPIWETVIAGIKRLCHERYKSRKAKRKDHLMKVGGYADIESARNKPPTNVDQEEWKKCIDYFIDPKQRKRSEINSRNRSKIQYPSLHGSRSYAAARHAKKMMSETQEYPPPLDTWRDMHTKASGEFVHPAAREDYDKLIVEQASLTQGAGSSSSVNEIGLQAMSKVLGERRGHNPGRGRKLKRVASSSSYEHVRSVVEKEYGEKLEAFMAETNMKMQQAMQQAMNAMRDPNAPIPDFAMFNMPQQPPNTDGDDNDDADLSVD